MAHDLSGYEEVPDRIVRFHAKYPEGSLQGTHQVVEVGGKTFVEYIAKAYRTADDQRPGVGTTWEPFPGTTPYTKNSEVENAETSAWGRALAALGFVGKKIASANEVRSKGSEDRRNNDGTIKPSASQGETISKIGSQKGLHKEQIEIIAAEIVGHPVEVTEGWVSKHLTGGRDGTASRVIDRLSKGPYPEVKETPVPVSDVPSDAPAHEPQSQEGLPWPA